MLISTCSFVWYSFYTCSNSFPARGPRGFVITPEAPRHSGVTASPIDFYPLSNLLADEKGSLSGSMSCIKLTVNF